MTAASGDLEPPALVPVAPAAVEETVAGWTVQFRAWYKQLPLVSLFISAFTIALFLFEIVASILHKDFFVFSCLSPAYPWHLWRYFLSPFVHYNVLHLVANVLFLLNYCVGVETALGSSMFFALFVEASFAAVIVQFVISVFLDVSFPVYLGGCTGAGFSPAVLALTLVAMTLTNAPPVIFGHLRVPQKYFPWLVFLVLQVLGEGYNLFGNLTGVALGYLAAKKTAMFIVPTFFTSFISGLTPAAVRASGRYCPGDLPALPSTTKPARTVRAVDNGPVHPIPC
jgi:membrane associated rhomboid family serine protease